MTHSQYHFIYGGMLDKCNSSTHLIIIMMVEVSILLRKFSDDNE